MYLSTDTLGPQNAIQSDTFVWILIKMASRLYYEMLLLKKYNTTFLTLKAYTALARLKIMLKNK